AGIPATHQAARLLAAPNVGNDHSSVWYASLAKLWPVSPVSVTLLNGMPNQEVGGLPPKVSVGNVTTVRSVSTYLFVASERIPVQVNPNAVVWPSGMMEVAPK